MYNTTRDYSEVIIEMKAIVNKLGDMFNDSKHKQIKQQLILLAFLHSELQSINNKAAEIAY